MRAHPPAAGQAAVRDAPAVHEALLPHQLHGPGPVRRGAEAIQHHPPAQWDGVGGGTAVPLVPRQLPGGAADPRGAAGEAPVVEVHPGAVPALRRPGQGVQRVPADGRGSGGGRPGEAGPQCGHREPEEARPPQGAAGQLPQGHADALWGTLSVGVHLTPQKTPHSTPSPCPGAWDAASALPPQQSPLGGGPQGRCKSGDKCHPLQDRGTVHSHGVGPIRNARGMLAGWARTQPPAGRQLPGGGGHTLPCPARSGGEGIAPPLSVCIFSSAFIKHQLIL